MIALSALGSTCKKELLKRTLDLSISDDVRFILHAVYYQVRPQDIHYALSAVAANPEGRAMAWAFVKEKWQFLYDRYYSGSMSMLGRIVSITTDSFSSAKWTADVEAFFGTF
jgi:aminopeptidase N